MIAYFFLTITAFSRTIHTFIFTAVSELAAQEQQRNAAGPTEMVVQCCRFLCYFCRTSRGNQKAMFEHLSYMLENSSMLLGESQPRLSSVILYLKLDSNKDPLKTTSQPAQQTSFG